MGLLCLLVGVAPLAHAGIDADSIIGARSLALSPDGGQLAFSYRGDIWVAPSAGGRATPITTNVEMDDNPIWSPDGKTIAFTSNRTGNNDIYLVDANGGQPRRLTWFAGSDIATDFTPDGKSLLLRSLRDRSENGIFLLDIETGRFRPVFYDMMGIGTPHMSPDGKSVLYTRMGFPWTRPRYYGSAASQLWAYDIASGKRTEIRNNQFQHLWPAYTANGGIMAVTVTERAPSSSPLNKPIPKVTFDQADTPNVYSFDGRSARALTNFVGEGTRYLTVARKANAYAFERDGTVYVANGGDAKPVNIVASVDDKLPTEERMVFTAGVSDFDRSADGKSAVFQIRGDIWTVPVEKGRGPNKDDATQLTTWEGSDDDPVYTPDGKAIFYVSDREGAERLYRMDVATKESKAITTVDADISNIQRMPDGKTMSFWSTGAEGGLFTVPVEGGTPKRVFKRPGNGGFTYNWSPDGKWVAFADALEGSGFYYWDAARNVYIVEAATGKAHDVTQISSQNFNPAWSSDGKLLYFGSNRQGDGIWAVSLKPDVLRAPEIDPTFTKPTAPVSVDIDFAGIEDRARRLIGAELSGPIQSDAENGTIYYGSAGDIWRADYNGENARRLTNGGGINDFALTDDGKNLRYLQNGTMRVLNLRAPGNPVTDVTFRADWTRNIILERRAVYAQIWREFNRGFYDPNFHGRNWPLIRDTYAKFLPSIGHRAEMATVLNMMIGELESSHSEVGAAPGGPASATSGHLGFYIDYSWDGPGIKVGEVPENAPGRFANTKLEAGEVVLTINGVAVSPNEALYRDVLNNQIGRELTMTVRGRTGETRTVKYRALSSGEFGGIVFNNLLDQRRRYVEEKSGGKLTYVHIAGMGPAELTRFQQQVWQRSRGKQGLIIDVRNNGGGNTSDLIIDILERQPNAFYQIRDESPISGPGQTLNMPMVVMCAETSFSNAEMFPSSMRSRGLAKLVGMPTPGYVIYTYGLPLIDGTSARMPSTGVFRLDGSNMENNGNVPDFAVNITPEQYFAGKDPQLDKAIEVLTKR